MTAGSLRSDQSRMRMALVFLVAGVMLLLWSWGSWVYRTSASARQAAVAMAPEDLEASVPVGAGTAFRQWLVAGAVLVATVAAGPSSAAVYFVVDDGHSNEAVQRVHAEFCE